MIFHIFGHPNIQGTHRNTLEFTKDKEVSRKGDCIIGVNSDFDFKQIEEKIKISEKMILTVRSGSIKEEITAEINKDFCDTHELVLRKSEFSSKRTLGLRSDKAAIDLSRSLIESMKNPETMAEIEIRFLK